MSAMQQHARNLVVMIAAGGAMDEVLEMAQAFGVRATQVQQLAVHPDEQPAQRLLVKMLKRGV